MWESLRERERERGGGGGGREGGRERERRKREGDREEGGRVNRKKYLQNSDIFHALIYACTLHVHYVISNKTGDCDWSTPCTSGVCFANNTGCPVVGVYILNYNQSTSDEITKLEIDYSEDQRHHHYIAGVFASVVAGIMVAISLSCIAARHRYFQYS